MRWFKRFTCFFLGHLIPIEPPYTNILINNRICMGICSTLTCARCDTKIIRPMALYEAEAVKKGFAVYGAEYLIEDGDLDESRRSKCGLC